MEILNKSIHKKPERKIKIMQFGEGNFLRAFVEWILQDLNDKGAIEASVAVVQPMPFGRVKELADQDGLYTLRLVGIDNGENVRKSQIIDVIGDCINPFTGDYIQHHRGRHCRRRFRYRFFKMPQVFPRQASGAVEEKIRPFQRRYE